MHVHNSPDVVMVLTKEEADTLLVDLLKIPKNMRGQSLNDLGLFIDNEERRKRIEITNK